MASASSHGPGAYRIQPGRIELNADHSEAERFGVDPGEFGNIGCDLAPVRPLPHLVGDVSDDTVKLAHGFAPDPDIGLAGGRRVIAQPYRRPWPEIWASLPAAGLSPSALKSNFDWKEHCQLGFMSGRDAPDKP